MRGIPRRDGPFKRSTAGALIFGLTLAGALSGGVMAGNEVSVALSSEPDGAAGDLTISIPATATGTSIPVFLKNLLPSTASDLRIYASATRADGGSLVGESAVTIAFPTADAGLVSLGPNDEIAGTLSLEGLTTPGKYTASIYLDHEDVDQQKIASVRIEKRSMLAFTLEGAGADGLQVTERSSAFERSLDLISGSTQNATVFVTLGHVIGPDGQPTDADLLADCKPASDPVTVEGLRRVPLLFRIATPLTGDYLGTLEILQAPDRITVPIKITRSRPAASVEMDGPLTTPVEFGPSGSTAVTFVLHETEGRTVSMAPPTLFVSRDVEGTRAGSSIDLGDVTTEPASAMSTPEPAGSEACTATAANATAGDDPNRSGESTRIVVPPGGSVTIHSALSGITEPGEYQGSLRFDVADGMPIKAEFVLVARRAALVAAIFILIGVIVGAGVRATANNLLPRLKLQSRLGTAAQEAARQSRRPNLGEPNRDILSDIRDRIREAAETLRSWDWPRAATEVDAIEEQVDSFDELIEIRHLYDQLVDRAPFTERVNKVITAMRVRTLSPANVLALVDIPQLQTELENSPKAPAMAGAPAPAAGPPPPSVTNRRIQLVTAGLWLALVIAATFLGVQVLWASNQVWGSLPDVIAALLWGGGIWAASGQPFGGTDALLKTIQGEA